MPEESSHRFVLRARLFRDRRRFRDAGHRATFQKSQSAANRSECWDQGATVARREYRAAPLPTRRAGSGPGARRRPANTRGRVITASMVGTTIEFFDFYAYATAASLVFPALFFPTQTPANSC